MDFEDPAQIKREITNLGVILNQQARAEEVNIYFIEWEKKVTDITQEFTFEQKPTVLLLQYTEQGGEIALDVPPANWLQTSMVELAGGIPIWKESIKSGSWMTVGLEQIAVWNPDLIFIINYYADSTESVEKLKTEPAWQELKAVKNNQIYGFAGDFLSWDQPDPRWVLGLNWIGNKMHPKLISFDINVEIPKFFSNFYGITNDLYLDKIKPVLKGSLLASD
jgi:iron complex transport system substrate-binding protein